MITRKGTHYLASLLFFLIVGCGDSSIPTEAYPYPCQEILFSYHYYGSTGSGANIMAICPDDPTPRQILADGYDNTMPYWSPDDSQIAFISNRSDIYQLFIMDRDGSNIQQLTFDSDLDVDGMSILPDGSRTIAGLVWLPDGNRIAVAMQGDESLIWQTYNLETGELSLLAGWDFLYLPISFSNDGTRMAYTERADLYDIENPIEIYVQDLDGSNSYQLTSDGWMIYSPAWSPDGSRIAFLSRSEYGTEYSSIYTIELDSGNTYELVMFGQDPWIIAWSPDGESLAVYADDEIYTGGVLYEINLRTGLQEPLFKIEQPNSINHLSW